MAELTDRRDPAARIARDRVAHMLGVHPRQLRTVDRELAVMLAQHLNQSNRRIQALVDMSSADDLTGALRRAAGVQALEREMNRARRLGDTRLAVAFVDVDGLKGVNDGDGHNAGDRLLQDVAHLLRTRLRAYDLVIRWGGDEFVCVLPEAGLRGASRILSEIARDFTAASGHTFSVGFAELGQLAEGQGGEELVNLADADLYDDRRHRRRRRPRLPWLGVAVGAAAVCLVMGVLAGSATPGSSFWGPHAVADSVWVAFSGSPAQAELKLAQDRLEMASSAPAGSLREAWLGNAIAHLEAAQRDGASGAAVQRVEEMARALDNNP